MDPNGGQFDMGDYSRRLNEALNPDQFNLAQANQQRGFGPGENTIAPTQIGGPNTSQFLGPQPGQPAAAAAPGAPPAQKKPTIPTAPPDFDMEKAVDPEKVKGVKTAGDLVSAMHPAYANKYMDWWEKQYGAISAKYDAIHQELGKRPNPDRNPTRKEKFQMLMEFGLHLMANSRKGVEAGVGSSAAIQETLADQKGRQDKDTAEFDARNQLATGNEQVERKEIGTQGSAMKAQSDIEQNQAQVVGEERRAKAAERSADAAEKPKYENRQTYTDKHGQAWVQGMDGEYTKVPGMIGMPGGAKGAAGGAGPRDTDFQRKLREFDTRNPLAQNATAEQKQAHDMGALAYAGGKGQVDSTLYAQARRMAIQSLGPRAYFIDDSGKTYDDRLAEETASVYGDLQDRSPDVFGGRDSKRNDPLGLR